MTMINTAGTQWACAAAACLLTGALAACGGGGGDTVGVASRDAGASSATAPDDTSTGAVAVAKRGLAAKRLSEVACRTRLWSGQASATKAAFGTSTIARMERDECATDDADAATPN